MARFAVTGTLTWWGHSTSTWLDGGTTVLFDPVLTARLGHLRRVRGPVPPSHARHADLILISHLHADHTHLPSLRLIPAPAVLIAPAGSRRLLKPIADRGLELREVEPGDLVESGGLRIRVLAADHDGRRHPGSPHRGPALGFLVEAPADVGIRETQVSGLRSRRWRPSISPWCQSEAGDRHLVRAISTPSRRQRRFAASILIMPSLCTGDLVADRPSLRTDLIDLPGPAFAEHTARLAPSTSVHLLRHGQSVEL